MNRTLVTLTLVFALGSLGARTALAQAAEPRPKPSPQPRPHSVRVPVDPLRIEVDDGDTVVIRWSKDDRETVRILGIDTPETRHLEHNLPYRPGSSGPRPVASRSGAFAAASRRPSSCARARSTRTAARSATCSSTAGTTRCSWCRPN